MSRSFWNIVAVSGHSLHECTKVCYPWEIFQGKAMLYNVFNNNYTLKIYGKTRFTILREVAKICVHKMFLKSLNQLKTQLPKISVWCMHPLTTKIDGQLQITLLHFRENICLLPNCTTFRHFIINYVRGVTPRVWEFYIQCLTWLH